MDAICKTYVDKQCSAFINSIDREAVCGLASSLNRGTLCHIFGEPKRGSYNVCFPVEFDSGSSNPERWMVRFPILPCLAFPEEKLRGEIATMEYLKKRTTIPVPKVLGYELRGDNPMRRPFIILEYIEGSPLFGINLSTLSEEEQTVLYSQLASIFIQLRQQEFDQIGSLTFPPNELGKFALARPLSVDVNAQEVGGLNAGGLIPPAEAFASATEYVSALTALIFNRFYNKRDSVFDEKDARMELYGLHQFRQLSEGWIRSNYNNGPFVLNHCDFSPSNIIVNESLEIVAVLDWEWSRVVPIQLFLPPSWLTGYDISGLEGKEVCLKKMLSRFKSAVRQTELKQSSEADRAPRAPLLSELWEHMTVKDYFIGHALLRTQYAGDICWSHLLEVENVDKNVDEFYMERPAEVVTVQQKLEDLRKFKEEAGALGVKIPDGIDKERAPPADLIDDINASLARADSLIKEKHQPRNSNQSRLGDSPNSNTEVGDE
ncbi:hypothetical protein FGG08_005601 [Glutinoglossum americanum]|uniref:Aminoglycoside phosphotransferase domain-containing protein n=1 Tax=Glutinoglossum americanum TaxID=1670608 RepID=A0A9P8I6X4_9PEZI|nr:hypothetical protein FGG08_005601 [Glutinoglossum americanum]